MRFAWHPTENLELAVVARNLLESKHHEFGSFGIGTTNMPTEIQHSVYAKLTWRF